MNLIKYLKVADIFEVANLSCGVLSILMSIEGNFNLSALLLFFITGGMLRLARYNVSEAQGFEGVPITVNGVLFPVLFLIYSKYPASLNVWPLIIFIQGMLMISTLKMSRIF